MRRVLVESWGYFLPEGLPSKTTGTLSDEIDGLLDGRKGGWEDKGKESVSNLPLKKPLPDWVEKTQRGDINGARQPGPSGATPWLKKRKLTYQSL